MNELLKYIPKEFKNEVADIYEGENVYNEETKKWAKELIVEWKNGEISYFANKTFARFHLKEFGI